MTPFHSKAYLSTLVNTADRIELVLALYEGAIAYVKQAIEAVEANDAQKRADAIQRTSNILTTLSESLDYTQAGGLAGQLFGIYNFQLHQLLEANRSNDVEPLQTVQATLTILLNGWQEVSRSPEAQRIRVADSNARAMSRAETVMPGAEYAALVMTA